MAPGRLLLLLLLGLASARGAALKILAIGDSLTEEYTSEATLAGIGGNIHNWPELIRSYRSTEANLGTFKSSSYLDWRTSGASANFAFPGFTTSDWLRIVNTTAKSGYDFKTRKAMLTELKTANVAVILIGANDLDDVYGSVFNNTEAPDALSGIVTRIAAIHDFVRMQQPALPIVICTIADVGATPSVAASYTDPGKRISTRAKVAALNQSVIAMALGRGATVARIDHLTDRAFDEVPFNLNGTSFILTGVSNNPAGHVFSQDNFHPATVGQFLITDEILTACTAATSHALTLFQNREILTLLGFDPDAPYNTWKAAYPNLGLPTADDDGDGIPNLVEFALGLSPKQRSSPWQFPAGQNGTLRFTTSPTGTSYAALTVLESTNLTTWTPVPSGRITTSGNTWSIAPSGSGKGFYRLKAETNP